MSLRSLAASVAALLGLTALAAPPAFAAKPVPQGFVGVVVDQPTWPNPSVDLSQQLGAMVSSGVESVRVVFDWSHAQPYRSWSQVPSPERSRFVSVGGVPTDFTEFDALVAAAAARRATVLPVIENAPRWDGQSYPGGIVALPRSPAPYAAFAGALVRRYGPAGAFWRADPRLPRTPVTMWQIWNEPNLHLFWPQQPYYARYLRLLRAAHDAIKAADRSAKVVLAGLTNYSWIEIARIDRRGGRNLFDVASAHPYTKTPQGVITILGYVRHELDATGAAGKPILADEISWPSSQGKTERDSGFDFATTESGQARNVRQAMTLLARNRARLRLAAFYYYDWAGQDRINYGAFDFAGLFHFAAGQFEPKPVYDVFRTMALGLEGCRAKSGTATGCS